MCYIVKVTQPYEQEGAHIHTWHCMHAGPAVSAFQKKIRGEETVLRDHICKQMNELNLERCRCIPKEVPGADWRCLEQLVAQDPARELYKVHLTAAGL